MKLSELKTKKKDYLVNTLFDKQVREYADYEGGENDEYGYGKRLPYIGWFWRTPDFVGKRISIGDGGDFIGVMENNKWDYPERYMIEEEVDTFTSMLEDAFSVQFLGGGKEELDTCRNERELKFKKIWDWFQTLTI